ncbi:MAG: D-alanyl-D-alanine carboxypeptidase [Olsenella sp.]|nr:D-alanyl-D-alanine carboxypeptidase [Olsenella sp.]
MPRSANVHTTSWVPTLALIVFLQLLSIVLLPSAAHARQSEPQVTEAQAYEIMDQDGNVLAQKNADAEMPMASITKIMSAIVALDSGKSLDDVVTLSQDLSFEEGAQLIGLKKGDTLTFRDLMLAMLVYSGNDAASYVAIATSGSEAAFVSKMNEKAAELGMRHTHFANPHGLETDGHYSSAHDLVVMGRHALEDYPFIAQAVMTRSITIPVGGVERTYASTDHLMDTYGGLCGIKTGAVAAGTTFLGSSKQYGLQTFSCVLGCETYDGRFTDTAALMDWAYNEYFDTVVFSKSTSPIRVSNYSLGFWGKVVTRTETDVEGRSYAGKGISYQRTELRSSLLDSDSPVAYASWYQEGRPVAHAVYETGKPIANLPSFNVFSLPLFVDVSELIAA